MYEHIPHITFEDGSRIYLPEKKLDHIKSKQFWTVSNIMKAFKIYHRGALRLIEYAQTQGVLSTTVDSYGRYSTLNKEV